MDIKSESAHRPANRPDGQTGNSLGNRSENGPDGPDASLAGIEHCPVCGRELRPEQMADSGQSSPMGWLCRCGEFVPKSLSLNSFQGCTHGVGCNCGRRMRR